MADPIAIFTSGTTMSVEDDAGVPVMIGGISGITGIGSGQASEIDITTLASTARESMQGLRDFGSITVNFVRRNADDVGQAELASMLEAQATREFVITLPVSTMNVLTFQGYVTTLPLDISVDAAVGGSATIRVTGPVEFS